VTILQAIQRSASFLEDRHVESPRLQAEWMLARILAMPRLQLYLNFEKPLAEPALAALREMVVRRGKREPLQHILGSVSFCGIELAVGPQALIPRPETEILAEMAWTWLNRPSHVGRPTVLDFGTGSGCLSVAIALKSTGAIVYALDTSRPALELARENARRHALNERINFLEDSGFSALPPEIAFDLVVSNPPYIPRAEIDQLEPEVRDHDPRLALDGGEDGLDFYRLIAAEASSRLRAGGRLMLEIGDGQGPAIGEILKDQKWIVESIGNDYTGRERFVTAARQSV
jgi:release factor glutamine methyltransferase